MSRQDKATSERFTKTLRELVKKPENKLCADCKRNDPRWASWNLGVFLCIRCSGIHRGMGTHISKVKSVDLDVWTPEQMESIQKWGNHRANLYWEAHLKAGHVPPDHKMESFIRSKYESKRWAMDGPPPKDPSILEDGTNTAAQSAAPAPSPPPTTSSAVHRSSASVSSRHASSPGQSLPTTRQPQAHQLLSATHVNQPARAIPHPQAQAQVAAPPAQPVPAPQNELFSLDFHAPAPTANNTSAQTKKDVILSLFSAPAAAPAPAFNQTSAWGTPQQRQQQPPAQQQAFSQPTSMMGQNGTGMWGVSSGWSGAPVPPTQGNIWSNPTTAQPTSQTPFGGNPLANTNDIWASSGSSAAGSDLFSAPFTTTSSTQKKDDVFGDLWGGFK